MASLPAPCKVLGTRDKITQLSCETCKERKVRCDKQDPCYACKATAIVCKPVYRKRLVRGRHIQTLVAENKDLHQHVARLEQAVANQNNVHTRASPTQVSELLPRHTPGTSSIPASHLQPNICRPTRKQTASPGYLASDFWAGLADKVNALSSFCKLCTVSSHPSHVLDYHRYALSLFL